MKQYPISNIRTLSDTIREFTLATPAWELAALTPGSHFRWLMPGEIGARRYSCVMFTAPATALTFAIKLNMAAASSQYLQSLKQGDKVSLEGPFNHFPQLIAPAEGRDVVIAGGIGVTPITGIVARLIVMGKHPECHYFTESRAQAVYATELTNLAGSSFHLHSSEGQKCDLAELLGTLQPDDRLHVCGSERLLSAVLDYCDDYQFPRQHIAFELFTTPFTKADTTEEGYEVEAAESGIRLQVAAGQSLLDALESAGLEPLYDCRRGECGVCALKVIEGDVEHRDFIMTPQEAATSGIIYPCVSHAKGCFLKLEL
ncbi:flavin reductase family protein [Xenorhabdus szentirmaii]|uniref:Vanillate O-demethylase oxidoreductase n=1 Tax=Xenorhabdus szentirmaii DSM 16338 TaxID=1427518 RepID=W1J6S0_9GAMM|nr:MULTISPECIES: iron-sulfur cluster-binding domain-containing protein [Xenorhabdus]MBD2823896.1 iron-sulfur cluster-binding domain-containing protein [Xenorhabdus sp. 5]PHM35318.1 oxidoreductase [Xenorhabdus szentirmaii DSM 16338]CDL85561.1 putative vanillate O-demethylase oxidoreductase [Xenorhabdus szentirmaii DSM 16338]